MVRITGFTLAAEPPRRGRLLLGRFDCELPGFELNGCCLWQLRNGNTIVHPPAVWGPRTQQHAIRITDPDLLAAIREAAGAAYQALGGTFDWPAKEPAHADG